MNIHPTKCNICGGDVIYTTNDVIYHGRTYGSGYCYLCTQCGASVGTHKPRPKEALGLLADRDMKDMKMKCHDLFDGLWSNREQRLFLYEKLAANLGIPVQECHFGYFNLDMLNKAYAVLQEWNHS